MSMHAKFKQEGETLDVVSLEQLSTSEGLRLARRQHGLSQVDLADLLRISQSNISRWENGYESIPRRMSVAMVDVFSESRERVHPFLRRLVSSDWRISILQFEKSGFLLDARILHLSKNLSAYFNMDETVFHRALSSELFDPTWRPAIYGSHLDRRRLAIEFERDCVRLTEGTGPQSCRLRSHQFMVECDGYAPVAISISSILGPATGEAPRVHSMVQMGDLPVLPPTKGVVQKVRKRVTTPNTLPMMQYAFTMGRTAAKL